MIKLLNVYKDDVYFYEYTGENSITIIKKYNPDNQNIRLHYEDDDYAMELTNNDIHIDICGNIYFELNDIKYIVDDGYRNVMIRAGYIVLSQYDKEKNKIIDRELGQMIKSRIIKDLHGLEVADVVDGVCDDTFYHNFQDDFIFKISYTSIDNLVKVNQIRKNNGQSYYPFDKKMDKYGTYFMCIYAERTNPLSEEKSKYDKADQYIKDIIRTLNRQHDGYSYHYRPIYIKKRIIDNGINTI